MYYVYILESVVDGDLYKGSSSDYLKRLAEHNSGESKFTRSKKPWKLAFVGAFENKRAALMEEKRIKRCNRKYLHGTLRVRLTF